MPKKVKEMGSLAVGRLGPGLHAVGGVVGLVLQVREPGAKSWLLRKTVAGNRREFGLGSYPTVTLAKARELAREALGLLRSGVDPKSARQSAKASLAAKKANETTFKQAAERYIASHAPSWKGAKSQEQWTGSLRNYAFPVIGALAVAEISTGHVLEILRPIWSIKTETAVRVRGRIEAIIAADDAEHHRERLNPARAESIGAVLPSRKKVQPVTHFASLDHREMPAFMKDLSKMQGVAARALEWTILTGARSHMTRSLTWEQLDLGAGIWAIPAEDMKLPRPWRSPLTAQMCKRLPAKSGVLSALVFPGLKGKPMSDATMNAVLKRMGRKVTVHGFRSTLKTWASEMTAHHDAAVEMQLAHLAGDAVEQAYQRGDLAEKRELLMADWSNYCSSN